MKKALIIVGIVVMVTVGWIAIISRLSNHEVEDKIKAYEKLAEEQMELEAYGSAINCYKNIISLKSTAENYLKLADVYEKAGKLTSYKETLEDAMEEFPEDASAYEKLSCYYRQVDDYQDCVDTVRKAQNAGVLTDTLMEDYYNTAFQYRFLTTGLGQTGRFYNGYAVVTINQKDIFVNQKMETVSVEYEHASPYISLITGVVLDGRGYYVDANGEKYFDSKESYEEAYSYSEGFSMVLENGKYYYISSANQKIWDGYEQATLFKNGVAAVKQGDKWSLITTSGEKITDTEYTDVLVDEDNICSNNGVIFVSEGKGYYMVDTEGKKISDTVYEDAEPFFESNITAIKKDGKWGFVNTEGDIIIEPQYEDARTFGKGIGAVQKDGTWGFVNSENRMVIEPVFEDAKCFSSNGIAPVKSKGTWGYIKLYVE